jgi:hypothetical protein
MWDWHARLAVVGAVPADGLNVKVATLTHPAKCGDIIQEYNDLDSDGAMDDGLYYANVMAYDMMDHRVALMLSGALFTSGAVLLTQPLGGQSHGRDLVIKDVTPATQRAVAAAPNRFVCIAGF